LQHYKFKNFNLDILLKKKLFDDITLFFSYLFDFNIIFDV